MGTYIFEEGSDVVAALEEYIAELEAGAKHMPREVRIVAVEALTDAYIMQTDRRIGGGLLYRLTNVVLVEELSDPRPDKVTLEEYPIMSERQLEHRAKRERAWPSWHINGDHVTGRRKGSYTDSNGTSQLSMQRIQKRF